MTADPKDPREAVIERTIRAAHTCGWHRDDVSKRPPVPLPSDVLARLDAADPLRAMLGDVVEYTSHRHSCPASEMADYWGADCDCGLQALLARLRTLTPTEGGTDDV